MEKKRSRKPLILTINAVAKLKMSTEIESYEQEYCIKYIMETSGEENMSFTLTEVLQPLTAGDSFAKMWEPINISNASNISLSPLIALLVY